MDDDNFVGSDLIFIDSVSVAPGCSPASSFFNLTSSGVICVVLDSEMYNMPGLLWSEPRELLDLVVRLARTTQGYFVVLVQCSHGMKYSE